MKKTINTKINLEIKDASGSTQKISKSIKIKSLMVISKNVKCDFVLLKTDSQIESKSQEKELNIIQTTTSKSNDKIVQSNCLLKLIKSQSPVGKERNDNTKNCIYFKKK